MACVFSYIPLPFILILLCLFGIAEKLEPNSANIAVAGTGIYQLNCLQKSVCIVLHLFNIFLCAYSLRSVKYMITSINNIQ